MKNFFVLILLISALSACKQEPKQAGTVATDTPSSDSGKLQLTCEEVGSSGDIPKSAVYAIVNERKTKVMEINAVCMQLEPAGYAGYGIPADAVAVVGSWFAGIGDFFYARQEGNQINVYHASIGEENTSEETPPYRKVATYEQDKITVYPLQ